MSKPRVGIIGAGGERRLEQIGDPGSVSPAGIVGPGRSGKSPVKRKAEQRHSGGDMA